MGFASDGDPERVPVPLVMVGTSCPDILPWELEERGLFLGHPAWVGRDDLWGDACLERHVTGLSGEDRGLERDRRALGISWP